MRVWVLGSGSAGNAVLVESAGTRIIIDAGFPVRELAKRLAAIGVSGDSIESAIVTHEHTDHVRGVCAAAKRWKWAGACEHGHDRGPSPLKRDLRAAVRGWRDARARGPERAHGAHAARRHGARGGARDGAIERRARGDRLRSRTRAAVVSQDVRAARHSRARIESRRGNAARGPVSAVGAIAHWRCVRTL